MFSKFLTIAMLLFVVASVAETIDLTGDATKNYRYIGSTALSFTADTLADSSTADTILTLTPKNGLQYILSIPAFTGNGADSVDIAVILESLVGSVLQTRIILDTITDSSGAQIYLPVHESIIGQSYRAILSTVTGNGSNVVPPSSAYLITRRFYNYENNK